MTRPAPPPAPALLPVTAPTAALVVSGGWQIEGLPATVRRAGPQAAERTVEFFTAQIRNPHTRAAYAAAVTRFFTWCDARGLALTQISPIAVGHLHRRAAKPVSRPHDQAAFGRHPPAVRLAGDRPGDPHQPGHLGARTDPRRQDGQDAGPAARRRAAAAGFHRHHDPLRPARIARYWP